MSVLIFVLGLFIGSFLNVCIYRIPLGESIAFPGSHCPHCSKPLKPIHLIPVLSFLYQGGKCAYCDQKISLQYPVIELINGLIYLFLYAQLEDVSLRLMLYAILCSLLIVITLIDLRHQVIPNSCSLSVFLLGVAGLFLAGMPTRVMLLDSLAGGLLGGGFLLLLAILTQGAMGGGDIKLMGALGFFFGVKGILLILLLSFVLGACAGLLLIGLKIKNQKESISFGPFIALAALAVMLYGQRILLWYQGFWLR